ncbi:hypothetical protein SAMN06295879_0510 [Agreia bicolorata]|uniref:Uncharacterized protein n=1 Tax=Agreia bicolorata TaxID=110935 RepID=A0A1T4X1E0_9MICO|nr:hypothetical protein [Agreia bicolorata]SKA82681.1 hypothetical protein SAMN06295879_0510 [Agreia bicolorata]
MATVYDDTPPPTAAWGSASEGSASGGSSRQGSGSRAEDAPPVNDKRSRPTIRAAAARAVGTAKAVAPPVARGAVQLGALAVQVIATAATLSVAGSILLLAGGYADNGVGSLLLCLVAAVFAAILTTSFVVLLGLPLRVARRARLWWIRNGELALVGAAIGAGLLVASAVLGGGGAPNGWLLVPGWLLFAFSLAHTWWPDRWRPERLRTKKPEPRVRVVGHERGDRRRRARVSFDEFLASSGRAFRGERD